MNSVIEQAPSNALILPGFNPDTNVNFSETVGEFTNRSKGFVKKPNLEQIKAVIGAVIDTKAAVEYSSMKANRPSKNKVRSKNSNSEQKRTGNFLSQVVENLMTKVDANILSRRVGKLFKNHNECTFCNIKFVSFFEMCRHVGSIQLRMKINHLRYQDVHVGTWVRFLASATPQKQTIEDVIDGGSSKKVHSPEIIYID